MNHIYRVIYNHSTNCWQAVSEIGRSRHKVSAERNSTESPSRFSSQLFKLLPLSFLISFTLNSFLYAAPQGGQVSAGQATISQQHLTTDIHQSSQNAVINWQKFDIQPTETVNFHQPNAQSITLNRVVGNEESVIRGAMNANGNVFISNPNGVLIGKEAQINVGSLVATTQNIKDDDLMNGKLKFDGQAGGKVENLANIRVPKGGVIALIAPIVKNSGKLTASEGTVLLASAEQFRITLPKDNFSYTLDRGTLQGLVDNKGAILADGGRVVLTAKGIEAVKKSVIKHSGAIEANTVSNKNGVVELLGDLDNSELQMTGSIKAEGKGTQQGGQVETSAASLKISEKAKVSTQSEKGKTGKWTIDPKDFTVAKSGGDMSGQAVSNALKNNNVELKSRNGAKEGKGDVIINDEISWDKNTLTLNAENDIHINKTLNGSGTAKLALEYGQGSDDGMSSSINLEKDTKFQTRTVRVNLPEGKNLTTQKGLSGEVMEFDVIHRMPEIKPDGSTEQFSSKYIALGKDIDLSYTKNHPNFLGWGEKAPEPYYGAFLNLSIFEGLGHRLSNLNISSEQGAENEESNGRHPYVEVGLFRNYEPNPENPNEPNRIISNVHLTDVNINTPNYWHVGGLVGNGQNIGIYNSSVSGTVIGKQQVGGLIGALSENGEIYNSHINGSISGSHFIGGLVGEADSKNGKINIEYGSAKGLVRGHTGNSGGLVGLATEIELSNSFSRNTIEGGDNLGGVIGVSSGNSISDVYSDSNINSSGYHGGIIGLEAPFKYSHKEYTSYLKRVVYAGNALTFLGKIEENKVDGERVVFNHENPNPDRNLVQEINNGHYDFKHIDIDDNQIWTVDERGIVKLREFTNNKPDYILDIDKPEPTPPDETDNIPQTTDIKVNYDKEKGFMIIPATQHEQLKITYTDNNGSTHTIHIKEGVDLFWYFPSGNSTGSTLNKNNGVLRWLNNLKEGSWITVEGMNSHSEPMVRKFEVDEFTGRKARLAEEERIRRAQQLAEQKRKDEEQKERQRQEELANKNNGNNTTGGNTSSGNNSSTTANSSNPVNMRKPLEDRLNQVGNLDIANLFVVEEPVIHKQVKGYKVEYKGLAPGKETDLKEAFKENPLDTFNKFRYEVKRHQYSLMKEDEEKELIDNLVSIGIDTATAVSFTEITGAMTGLIQKSPLKRFMSQERIDKLLKDIPDDIKNNGDFRKDALFGTLYGVFGSTIATVIDDQLLYKIDSGKPELTVIRSILKDATSQTFTLIAQGLGKKFRNGESISVDDVTNFMVSILTDSINSSIKAAIYSYESDNWKIKSLQAAGEFVSDVLSSAAKSFLSSAIETGGINSATILKFQMDFVVQLSLLSGQQVIRTADIAWDVIRMNVENMKMNSDYIMMLAAVNHRIEILRERGINDKADWLMNNTSANMKNNAYAESKGVKRDDIPKVDSLLAQAYRYHKEGKMRELMTLLRDMEVFNSSTSGKNKYNLTAKDRDYIGLMLESLGVYFSLGE